MVKKRGVEVALGISIAVVAVLSVYLININEQTKESSVGSTEMKYNAIVDVYKNGVLVSRSHNVLYDLGRNFTRDILGSGSLQGPFQNVSLCNASTVCATPVALATEAFTGYTNCGLSSQAGTYAALGGVAGNWTITKTFTSTCDSVNTTVTRLTNQTGGIFAGNSFTLVTLQTNDQLTINWTLMIT